MERTQLIREPHLERQGQRAPRFCIPTREPPRVASRQGSGRAAACVVGGGEDSEPLAEGERPCPPLAPLPLEGPRLPRDCWAQP